MFQIMLVCAMWTPFAAAQQALLSNGETFTLAGIPYYAPPTPVSQFSSESLEEITRQLGMQDRFSAFSVMPTRKSDFVDSDLDSMVQAWKTKDDVWSEAFLHGMRPA